VGTPAEPPVQDDPATDARAERDHERQVGAPGGAVAVLRPGRGVGVVADPQRPLQPGGEVLAQRGVPPGEVRAEQHRVAGAVEPPGGTHADADQLAVVPGGELLDHRGDGVLGVGDRGARRRPARGRDDGAVGRDDATGDLRAPDVDAERGRPGRRRVRHAISICCTGAGASLACAGSSAGSAA
jgi:hypothetical protein